MSKTQTFFKLKEKELQIKIMKHIEHYSRFETPKYSAYPIMNVVGQPIVHM